ncbi:hypothetical protein G2W53_041467 [Senna tora]|uniref:Uncharacterized protein n=1 Tax=Senna tora TaxID=362788 RepID=A0A834W1E8_9FABA|nr:hypothetical protein G2W53_041467 [Senna tora]
MVISDHRNSYREDDVKKAATVKVLSIGSAAYSMLWRLCFSSEVEAHVAVKIISSLLSDLCLASSFIASAMLNLIPAITFVITAFTGFQCVQVTQNIYNQFARRVIVANNEGAGIVITFDFGATNMDRVKPDDLSVVQERVPEKFQELEASYLVIIDMFWL